MTSPAASKFVGGSAEVLTGRNPKKPYGFSAPPAAPLATRNGSLCSGYEQSEIVAIHPSGFSGFLCDHASDGILDELRSTSTSAAVRCALALSAVIWALACGPEPPQGAPSPQPAIAPPIEPPAAVADGQRYVAVLAAQQAVDVAAQFDGKLTDVLAHPGDVVTSGQVLARLDEQPMREALRIAQAERRSAQQKIAQYDIEIAEARRQVGLQETLYKDGLAAKQDLDQKIYALDKASKIKQHASAQLAEQDARIAQLQRRLRDATLTAPFAGAVARRYREPGAVVAAGAPIIRLIRNDALWVRFAIPPTRAGSFATGDSVTAELESPALALPATIRHIAPEIDPASQMIVVEAALDVPEAHRGALRAGMPAWVTRVRRPEGPTQP